MEPKHRTKIALAALAALMGNSASAQNNQIEYGLTITNAPPVCEVVADSDPSATIDQGDLSSNESEFWFNVSTNLRLVCGLGAEEPNQVLFTSTQSANMDTAQIRHHAGRYAIKWFTQGENVMSLLKGNGAKIDTKFYTKKDEGGIFPPDSYSVIHNYELIYPEAGS